MRKFLNIMAGIMLLAVSALLHGCKDDDGFILPYNLRMEDTTVQSGERLNIQGQGFSAGVALIFETLDAEYRFQAILEEGDITTDGISVTLPDNFVYEETYRIYLVRGLERAEIGRMKVSIGAMQQFRLMSSNIRVWTGDSGEPLDSPRRWENRRSALVAMYKDIQPDIIGTQEAYLSQWNYLKDQLAPLGYDCVGKVMSDWSDNPSPKDTNEEVELGQAVGIFFRTDAVSLVRWGVFSLSETPDEPIKAPALGAQYKRQATWAEFELKDNGRRIFHLNTHLDTKDNDVRSAEMKLIMERVKMYNTEDLPVLLTADWNAAANSVVFDSIRDSYNLAKDAAQDTQDEATNNGYGNSGSYIDHIWFSKGKGLRILTYRVVKAQYDPAIEYYSDHWSIYSDFQF